MLPQPQNQTALGSGSWGQMSPIPMHFIRASGVGVACQMGASATVAAFSSAIDS